VSFFQNYRQFIDGRSFRSADFLAANTYVSGASADFVGHLLKTQMFSRFLEESIKKEDPAVLFFDESINAKLNRSKKAALTHIGRGGGKKTTDFLDDRSAVVSVFRGL
jgi:hypothetical protein